MMMKKALILGAMAAVLLGPAALALGEEVVVEPEPSWSEPEEAAEALTPAMMLGLEESACEIITLPPIDREALLAEDEASAWGKINRSGSASIAACLTSASMTGGSSSTTAMSTPSG